VDTRGFQVTTREDTRQSVVATVHGDYHAFSRLLQQPQEVIEGQAGNLPELVLTTQAVHKVLCALQRQEISPQLAQAWASFVRRGYVGNKDGQDSSLSTAVKPLTIVYDPKNEEQIVEVLSRLDEIGDLIDGTVTDDELALLLQLCRTADAVAVSADRVQ